MTRLATSLCAPAISSFLLVGCIGSADEDRADDVRWSEAARTADCVDSDTSTCDPTLLASTSAIAFTITAVSSDSITGVNDKGQRQARFTAGTAFRIAWPQQPGDPYEPGDPYYPADPYKDEALAYNLALLGGVVFTDSSAYMTYIAPFIGGKARIWIDKRDDTVRAFRPVATY